MLLLQFYITIVCNFQLFPTNDKWGRWLYVAHLSSPHIQGAKLGGGIFKQNHSQVTGSSLLDESTWLEQIWESVTHEEFLIKNETCK